jgi:hypothetical protein
VAHIIALASAALYRRAGFTAPVVAPAAARGELGTIGAAAVGGLADTPSGQVGEAEGAQVVAEALTNAQGDDSKSSEYEPTPDTPELVD